MARPAEPPPRRCQWCERHLRVKHGGLVCTWCDGPAAEDSVKQKGAV